MKKPGGHLTLFLLHVICVLSAPASIRAATEASPEVLTPPGSQTVRAGQNASFYIVARGDGLTYQWRKDGADIPGATGTTYNTGPAQTNMAGAYTVVMRNSSGSITSAPPVALTVQPGLVGGVIAWSLYEDMYLWSGAQSGVTAISAGREHLVALREDGSVIARGDNSKGQTNVPAAARSGVTAIAAGHFFTLALKADGSVLAWGDNSLGQTEVPAAAASGVAAIAAGYSHALALKIDGSVVGWGRPEFGIFGGMLLETTNNVKAIAASGTGSLFVKSDGSVVGWGNPSWFPSYIPRAASTGVVAVALGDNEALALKEDGSVVHWGEVEDGYDYGDVPVSAQSGVVAIASGSYYGLALKTDGSVVSWPYAEVPITVQNVFGIAANDSSPVRAVLGVPEAPAITQASGSIVVHTGRSIDLNVTATGFPLSFQWQKDGIDIPLATKPTIPLPLIQAGQAGAYTVVVSNSLGVVTSAPPAVVTVDPTVEIVAQPASQSVRAGQNATFYVVAAGDALRYQWRKDGVDIQGATTATYNTGPAQRNMAGGYTVVVSNQFGSITSAPPATLTVQPGLVGGVLAWYDVQPEYVPPEAQSGVTAISVGSGHIVALKEDGSVIAWGDNSKGQINVPEAARSGVTAVAAGSYFTLALKADGSVLAWGENSTGQTEVPAAAASGVVAIAAGGAHALALKIDGSVVGWGRAFYAFSYTMPPEATNNVKAIAASWTGSYVLKSDGSVAGWGDPSWQFPFYAPPATSTGVVAVALGAFHALGLKEDGSVVQWGDAEPGADYGEVPVSAQSGVVAIAGGLYQSFALKADGSVVSWPYAEAGPATVRDVFGIAAANDSSSLRAVLGVPASPTITQAPGSIAVNGGRSIDLNVVATGFPLSFQWQKDGIDIPGATKPTISLPLIQAGQAGAYTVVVSNALGVVTSTPPAVVTVKPPAVGAVIGWGANPAAVPPAAYEGVRAIAAGDFHGVALKTDGTVVAWGHSEGEFGNGTNVPAGLNGVTAIAAGSGFTLALRFDGSVVAWGDNWAAQTNVPIHARSGVIAIAAGSSHGLALRNDRSVVAWGNNHNHQTEVPLAARSDVIAIAAGSVHSVALKIDGSVIAWGGNSWGQANVPLDAQSGVIAIAAGDYHTMALKANGSVVGWGHHLDGRINIPLAARSGVIAIEAAYSHSVALKSDGSVVSWGTETTVPEVATSGVTAISAGSGFTLALLGGESPAPVPLTAKSSGNGLILSWPAVANQFRLQFSTNLTPPVAWTDCPDVLSVVNSEFAVTNAFFPGARFYRLAGPNRKAQSE